MADWTDFETIRQQIKYNTVDKLKHIVNGLNEQCAAHITKSGKKQDLIDRITSKLDGWRRVDSLDKWSKAKVIFNQVRDAGIYNRPSSYSSTPPTSATYGNGPQSLNAYASSSSSSSNPIKPLPSVGAEIPVYNGSLAKYDPYAPPRKPDPNASPQSPVHPQKSIGIRFKLSPFFRVDQAVSSLIECPESTATTDRRSQSLSFTLTPDQLNKIQSSEGKFQLRLYCTSSQFYFHNANAFRSSPGLCPIEFPPTCEVRVNGNPLTANLKGLKKKPGTAPPAEIPVRIVRTEYQAINKLEMIYVNSQQPIQPKKYYLIVMLVEVTTVDQLVDKLRKGKFRSAEDVKAQSFLSAAYDDDIVLGSQKLSLKCPLSYIRIETPCRSKFCTHPQCFDARSWFQMMEQTSTWLCPVCEKILQADELIVDGYFQSILDTAAEEVEDVLVEADGEWHTSDNAFASMRWKSQHPPITTAPVIPDGTEHNQHERNKSQSHPMQIVSLCDSENSEDEEEESVVQRELSYHSNGSSFASADHRRTTPSTRISNAVIDLTLDSDEEERPARATPSSGPSSESSLKRKAEESLGYRDAAPQRPRVDTHYVNGNVVSNGIGLRNYGPPSAGGSRYNDPRSAMGPSMPPMQPFYSPTITSPVTFSPREMPVRPPPPPPPPPPPAGMQPYSPHSRPYPHLPPRADYGRYR